jgi:DNA topoisomerase VI subunit B
MAQPTLARTTFETSRALEFFSERELTMQIGFGRQHWPIALTKELIDNALDACETAGVAPEITVGMDGRSLTVADNGPGLPLSTIERSLDYMVRVSDKAHYVSPSRGQLGNALKCLWAAPFVARDTGDTESHIEIHTGTKVAHVAVSRDPLAQGPRVTLDVHEARSVKTGTSITVHWPGLAMHAISVRCPLGFFTEASLTCSVLTVCSIRMQL